MNAGFLPCVFLVIPALLKYFNSIQYFLLLQQFFMSSSRPAALSFIFITVLIDVIGFGIIIPVLPDLIRELIHGDLSLAATYGGWLLFAYAIMQFLFAPVLGNLSD